MNTECGTGKDGYTHYRTASMVARRTMRNKRSHGGGTVPTIYPFHCHECGMWHLTGNSQPKLKAV
jgi:hypothetical protein